MGRHPPFSKVPYLDPNQGQGWPNWANFPPSPGMGVNGVENAVYLAAIRVGKESRLASRRIGRDPDRAIQK